MTKNWTEIKSKAIFKYFLYFRKSQGLLIDTPYKKIIKTTIKICCFSYQQTIKTWKK